VKGTYVKAEPRRRAGNLVDYSFFIRMVLGAMLVAVCGGGLALGEGSRANGGGTSVPLGVTIVWDRQWDEALTTFTVAGDVTVHVNIPGSLLRREVGRGLFPVAAREDTADDGGARASDEKAGVPQLGREKVARGIRQSGDVSPMVSSSAATRDGRGTSAPSTARDRSTSGPRRTRLVLYALPNGNTIAWTVGKLPEPGDDWHYGIQHIGAQTRLLRHLIPDEEIIVAYLEAPGRSWPAWRRSHGAEAPLLARRIVEELGRMFAPMEPRIELVAHSGGGSFLFAFVDAADEISTDVDRFVFLDANYGFSAESGHGRKFEHWLRANPEAVLVVAAYDDRRVTLDGKPVVGPTGGTWRATERMVASLGGKDEVSTRTAGDILHVCGCGGKFRAALHKNPENRILHTVLVERNGFVWGLLVGSRREVEAPAFFSEPAYTNFLRKNIEK
jgi:hypothetical protein